MHANASTGHGEIKIWEVRGPLGSQAPNVEHAEFGADSCSIGPGIGLGSIAWTSTHSEKPGRTGRE